MDGRTVWYGRHVRGCRASIVAAVLLLASFALPAEAAEPTIDASAALVVFAVDPRSRDAQAMIDAVRAHLTGLPVRLVVDGGTGGTPAATGSEGANGGSRHILGTLTIDPGTPGEWVVSFTEPAIDTTLVRRIRLKPQGKGVALEEAAIVVRSMVEAILDGGHVGIARLAAQPDEPLSPAAPAARRPLRHGIAGQAVYIGTTFASGLGLQSGLLIGLRWQFRGFYAGPSYTLFPWIATNQTPASLLLVRHPGAIMFGYEGSSRLAPTIEIDLLADYIQRTTVSAENGFVGTAPDARWSFGLGAQAGVSWSILTRVRLLAQGGVDWMINSYSYVALPNIIVASAPIRPKLGLGLAVDLW